MGRPRIDQKAYYRIWMQILILIRKLYSISMDHAQMVFQPSNTPQQGHQSHPSGNSPDRKKQIQNADLRSQTASINENIQNNGASGEEDVGMEERGQGNAGEVFRKGRGCAAGTVLQFSILIGLIVIQYISSAVTLLPLFAVLLLALLIYSPLTVLQLQLPSIIQQRSSPAMPQRKQVMAGGKVGNEDIPIRTIPKINQEAVKRANAKTKKLQFANTAPQEQKNTQLTIKKQADSPQEPENTDQSPTQRVEAFVFKKTLVAVFKVLQIILQVSVASLSLFSFSDAPNPYHKAIVTLCIVSYILAVASSVMFALFFKQINSQLFTSAPIPHLQQKQQNQPNCFEHPQPQTKISIDQLIQAKPKELKKAFSIDIKVNHTNKFEQEPSQKMEQRHETKSQVQKEAAIKLQIKRSVLKPSKIHQTKSRKTSDKSAAQQMMQRRRVQINSKKIQYFEYSQISPAQSIADEDKGVKTGIKSKFNSQRMKYTRQRMQAENRILSSKIMARQTEKETRSQGCLSTYTRSSPMQQEEGRIDHYL